MILFFDFQFLKHSKTNIVVIFPSCQGGASSLKLRWHGCGGLFTIPLSTDAFNADTRCEEDGGDDGGAEESFSPRNEKAKFIDCDCYASLLSGLLNDGCALLDEWNILPSDASFSDMCIVSTIQENDGGPWVPKLNVALPSTLLLHHSAPDVVQEDMNDSTADWNQFPLITYLDTSCDTSRTSMEGSIPIYPGYGKFANTCPSQGLIDLMLSENSQMHLPHSLDGFYGQPPKEMFWFEFRDGTSTSFWPSGDETPSLVTSSYFNPSFSQCTCNECPSEPPSSMPTIKPTTAVTEEFTQERAPGCPTALYEDCLTFASTRCISKDSGDICRYSFAGAEGSQGRKLSLLKDVATNMNHRGKEESHRLLSQVFSHVEFSQEWVHSQIEQHLHEIHLLKQE
jgi:hypothetical protein